MMNAVRGSLRGKIFAAVLVAALLPFLATVWLLARQSEADLRAAALGEARSAGALARALAQERASRLVAVAQAIALTPELGQAISARDRPRILQLTQPWLPQLGTVTVALTDERGVMVLRTYAPERYGDSMTETTKGLLPALRGAPTFSTEAAGLRGLAIRGFGPVAVDGRLVGVVAVTQNLDREFLAALQTAGGFQTFAVFPDGSTVGDLPDVAAVAAAVRGGGEQTTLAQLGGRWQAAHAWPLADPDGATVGHLGIVFPLDALSQAQQRVRLTAAGAGLAATAAAALLAWLLSRAAVAPVERISRAARSIASGAVVAIPPIRSGDELEELSASLSSMLATLSEQAGRLEELNARLAHERGRAEALAEASRAFAEARLDPNAVLPVVARQVAELLGGGCVVRELSEDGRLLTPVAFHHTDAAALAFWRELFASPQPAGGGINGRVVQTGQTVLLASPTAEEVRAAMLPEHRPFHDKFGVRSLLVVPLRAQGRSIGTLAAQRTTTGQPFTEEDQAFLQDVANRAALAIEHAQLYASVRESEERYRAVVEQSADAILVVEGTTVVYANHAYAQLIGLASPDDAIGRPGDTWIHPTDRSLVVERTLARQRGEAVPPVYEFRIVRGDGEIRTVEVAATPITRAGRPATLAVLRDATERKRAEAAQRLLSEASAVLGSSLEYETTLDTVARLLVPDLADWCTVYLRRDGELERVAGAHADPERGELLRQLSRQYPRRADRPDPVRRVVETGEPLIAPTVAPEALAQHAYDDEHKRLLQALDPRSALIVPLVARGEVLGAIGLNRSGAAPSYRQEDLALARQLADRCAAAIDNAGLYAEAQEAIQARDQFLSIAAHELKTPITSLKGHAQLLLRGHARGSLDSQRLERSLEALVASSNRLASLTDDLLDVGRLRTGRLALRPESVDVADLVRDVATRFEGRLDGRHELVLNGRADTGSACVAQVDVARVEQVLTNLLDNAVKYSPAGGAVRVTVRPEDGGVAVAVADSGIGLPAGSGDQIFEPFGRAANATAGNLPGMGLGLYVSRGIVEQHGGWIRAESAGEEQGTTVTVWLPARCSAPQA